MSWPSQIWNRLPMATKHGCRLLRVTAGRSLGAAGRVALDRGGQEAVPGQDVRGVVMTGGVAVDGLAVAQRLADVAQAAVVCRHRRGPVVEGRVVLGQHDGGVLGLASYVEQVGLPHAVLRVALPAAETVEPLRRFARPLAEDRK